MKVAPGLNTEKLKAEIGQLIQQTPVQIIPLKSKNLEIHSHPYLVEFNQETNIRKIPHVSNIQVKWEQYSRKSRATQCLRHRKLQSEMS